MEITQEQFKSIKDQIGSYLNRCPVCNGGNFVLNNTLFVLPEFAEQRGVLLNGDIFPLVLAKCQNCHYVRFFSAVGLGIVNSD